MKKRSLFLSATLGVALTLMAASPSGLALEGTGQPRVSSDGTSLPTFTGFPQSVFNTADGRSATLPVRVPGIADTSKGSTQRPGLWKAAAAGELRGLMTSCASWTNAKKFHSGIYSIPTSGQGGRYTQLTNDDQSIFGGAMPVYTPNGYFISVSMSFWGIEISREYKILNPEDWSVIQTYPGDMTTAFSVLAYDDYTDNVAVLYKQGTECGFGYFDIFTGRLTKKKVYPEGTPDWKAMAFGKDGKLFAFNTTGDLLKVDSRTGEFSKVGNIGFELNYSGGAAYDRVSDTFYMVVHGNNTGGGLYSVDTETANLTQIYPFNDEEVFYGLYFTNESADDKAPAAVNGLQVNRDKGSLTVDVDFTMPSTTFDGSAASGSITYKVYLNGEEKASGNSQYGKSESVKVTAPEDGYYSVCVVAFNSEGKGEPTIEKAFIGYDSPLPVTDVTMTYDGSKFDVSWEKPLGDFGGYIDYSQVTYTVTRMPDNVVVADGISETSCIDNYAIPSGSKSYYFNVAANYRGQTTAPTSSNSEILGFITPPYREGFDTQDDFNAWTRFSRDGDMINWDWHPSDFYVCATTFWKENTDAWLISPEIKVEAGKTYQISIDVASREPGRTENFRLWVGDKCEPESMTAKVIEHEDYDHPDFHTLTGDYTATKSGTIYIGLEAYNKNGVMGNTVKADNLYVSGAISPDAPDAVTDLEIKAADYGKLEARISFKAPAKTVAGKSLSSIDNIKVYRNGTEIETLKATPGQTVSYTDANKDGGIKNGNNIYDFVAFNSVGSGRNLSKTAYIGFATPVTTAAVRSVKGTRPNIVEVSWDAVTTDVNGNLLPTTGVTYTLARLDLSGKTEIIYTGTDLSYTDTPCEEDSEQAFYYYGVVASIGEFNSAAKGGPVLAVGKPYAMPWGESFADKTISSICVTTSGSQNYGWSIYSDADVIGMTSSDGDNGMAIMASNTEETGISSDIGFGYVDLSAAKSPCLLFDFYGYNSKNTISVLINEGQRFKESETFTLKTGAFWTRKAIDLKEYAGNVVQVAFRGTINDNPLIAIDNIRIADVNGDDLKAISLNAPRKAEANVDVPVTFTYSNEGLNDAKDYTVRLLRDGVEVENVKGEELEPGEKAEIVFKTRLSVMDRDDVVYNAIIDYDADADKGNNEAECVIGVDLPDYPVVGALTVRRDDNENVVAEWNDPDLSQAPYEVTVDGAEDYPAYSIGLPHSTVSGDNLGEWTVIDGDGIKTYSHKNVDYPNEGEAMAWMAFNNVECGLGDSFPVYDGKQQFVCFVAGEGQTDDWLISPELQGCAQTISFMALTVDLGLGSDQFEIWYSTTGKERDDFKKLEGAQTVPSDWTSYGFDLPEGAKYFAIRCVSTGTYALAVDNIRFIKADASRISLAVNGYNIYRNSQRINAEPVVENTYLDKDPEARKAGKYEVTVVYDRGESAPCEAASISAASGISDLGGGVKVSVERGALVVTGAEGQRLTVCSASGLVMADIEVSSVERIPLAKGVYTLRVGNRTVKVMI